MTETLDDAALLGAFEAALCAALDAALPDDAASVRLADAMRYACRGGKRLRALLVYRTGTALDQPLEPLHALAVAVELVHAYSLVHDDLPAMDDDDLRRGQPTVHRAFDEATAILVGDALNTLAFEVLAGAETIPAAQRATLIAALAQAAGARGMVGGQHLDLMATQQPALDLHALQRLHQRKTGALIHACLTMPGLLAQVDARRQAALSHCGEALGLAYQIQDDLLDVESVTQMLGKTAGKDLRDGKQTYVSLLGAETARAHLTDAFHRATEAAHSLPQPDVLQALLQQIALRAH